MFSKIIKRYKSIDRRSPIQIEIDNVRAKWKEEAEEVERYLKSSSRFSLVEKRHQICWIYHFDILDTITWILYKDVSYSWVFKILDILK